MKYNASVSGETADVLVVGAGIVGLATAWQFTQRGGVRVRVVEAEGDVALHQTGRNSGVIHSGLYYREGSLKASLCRKGREQLLAFCQKHQVPFELCGKLVVASSPEQVPALEVLFRQGQANGIERLAWVEGSDIPRFEPHARGEAALWVGDTGIVEFRRVARALAREVEDAGGTVSLGFAVRGLERKNGLWVARSRQGEVAGRVLVVCAGLEGDRLARQAGAAGDVRIVPFRGEYWELAPHRRGLVRNLIYPVPDPRFPFLGVHFTRKVDGRVEAGPNAVLAPGRHAYRRLAFSPKDTWETLTFPGFWRLAARYWRTGLAELWRSLSKKAFCRALQRLVPAVRQEDLVHWGCGIRAQAMDRQGQLLDDFAFAEAEDALFVLNAPSPAATACLAIGAALADACQRFLPRS
jgi:L-2-hydroxyglutarate oxidase LhgO